MDGAKSRFWGYVGGQLQAYGGLVEAAAYGPGTGKPNVNQWTDYATRWAYYENRRLYDTLKQAGRRSQAMPAGWNPVPATVAFYVANVLGGDLEIAAETEATDDRAALRDAIDRLWEWSNFPVLKRELVETAAVLTNSFLKVAERQDDGDNELDGRTTAVYLQNIPPERVVWWEADERGYVTSIRIDTPRLKSAFSGEEREHTLVEVWRKRWDDGAGGVRFYEARPGTTVEDRYLGVAVRESTFADLGYDFIPLVWVETAAYWWHQVDQIDRYNELGLKLDRLNRATGVIHGRHVDKDGRPMPAPNINTREVSSSYEEAADGTVGWIRVPGNAQFDWAPPPHDLAAVRAQMLDIRQGVEASLPEYRVATLDASQVATETLQMLLSQAGQRVLEMREGLERGLARAQMMAISIAQAAELPGFEESAVGSWEDRDIAHVFVGRDVFEVPLAIRAEIIKSLVAAGIPVKLAMKRAGFSEEEIAEYDAAAAEESLRRQTTLAAQLSRQAALFDSGAADNGLTRP